MRVRIATLNVWGLPWGLASDLPRRIEAIGARLPELEADAVAFQEVWTRASLEHLVAAGRAAGLDRSWHHRPGLGGGGLLVLTRLPVLSARFEAYRARGLPERIWHGDHHAGKGFAELRLDAGAGPLALFATHLHSQYAPDADDDYRGHRMAQVVQLAVALRGVAAPVVALGDFNLREDQPHHRALVGLAGLRDAGVELRRREPTVEAANPYSRARPRPDARIDYVFARNGAGRGVRARTLQRVFREPLDIAGRTAAYSDHAGLLTEIELAEPAADPPGPAPEARSEARALLLQGRDAARVRQRERTLWATAGLGAGGAALWASRRAIPRRAALRRLALAAGLLSGAAGLGAGALAALASPDERRAFERALAQLDALR